MSFRIVYLSIQTSDPSTLEGPVEDLREAGLDPEFYGVNAEDAGEDVLVYSELVRRTRAADFVYVRCMADVNRFRRWDRYEKVLEETEALVFVGSGSIDVTMLQRPKFRGTDGQFLRMHDYCVARGRENDRSLLMYAANILGITEQEPPAPVLQRSDGIYHRGFPRDVSRDDYIKTLKPGRITIGIVFTASFWLYGNTAQIDALTEEIESRGMNAIPVFYSGISYDVKREKSSLGVAERYFCEDGKPVVDAVISCNGFSFLNNSKDGQGFGVPDDQNFYRTLLNVPVIQAISVTGEYHDFEQDSVGLGKGDIQANVVFPELDGDIISVPFCYTPKRTGMKRATPVPDRISRLVDMAQMWAGLRRKPVKDRRIAILMWQSRPNSGCIGNAAGLDTPESVADMLKLFSENGYTVTGVPKDGKAMMEEILDNVTNDLDVASPETVREKAAALVDRDDYKKQFEATPGWSQNKRKESWGEPPGEIMVDGRKVVIPGTVKGNVYVGYQPLRGWAERMEQDIHDPTVFAQHQYLAFYRWIKDTFGADMVFHMGTHGTVEWLPGKNVGMSAKCEPDVVLEGIPNLYPYVIDDPGEGIQCKRRSFSVLLGHMPPTMARADTYEELEKVEAPLQDYFRLRATASPDRMEVLVSQIYDAAKDARLLRDLGIDGERDPGAKGFEPYVIPLHEYLTEVKDALVRSDMHVLGRAPEGEHLEECVYSLMRLDNGGVRSLRDSFADQLGIDLRAALDDPSGVRKDGELNSAAADRADSALRSFIGWMREDGWDADRALAHLKSECGEVRPDLADGVRYVCEKLVPNILRTSDETRHMLDGLNGEYVLPGPSGAPTRGHADILPMGRNFYAIDPSTVPNRSSWVIGRRMADQMIERYVAEKGEYPREVGFVIWATDAMKTGGDDMSYILWLMGVKPVWAETGDQVVDLEVVPLEELKRPRIDVTVNITGLFRDTFPNLIDMIDDAVKLVADLDESDEDNALAANLRRDIVQGIAEGLTPDEARQRNSVRVFGAPPGAYGTGVNKLIETSRWKSVQDLADMYVDWCSNGYSRGNYGQKLRGEFVRRFSKVGVTVKNMPDREIDLLDCDDVYEYLGGMNAFVRAYGRKDAMTVMGDGSDPKNTKVRDTRRELQYVFRSKALNPKYINGLMEHGYRGAAEMANLTEYTMAWGATSDIAEDWMYEGITDKYLADEKVKEWMEEVNPYARMNILQRLQEAIERGLWDATDEYREKIKRMYLETEERIEEMTDRGRSALPFLLPPLLLLGDPHVLVVDLSGGHLPPQQDADDERAERERGRQDREGVRHLVAGHGHVDGDEGRDERDVHRHRGEIERGRLHGAVIL